MSTTNTQSTVNGVDVDALRATVDAVRGDRKLGEVTFAVNGTGAPVSGSRQRPDA